MNALAFLRLLEREMRTSTETLNKHIGPYATFIRNVTLLALPFAALTTRRKRQGGVNATSMAVYGMPQTPPNVTARIVAKSLALRQPKVAEAPCDLFLFKYAQNQTWPDWFQTWWREAGYPYVKKRAQQVWGTAKRGLKWTAVKTYDTLRKVKHPAAQDLLNSIAPTITKWRKELGIKGPGLLTRAALSWFGVNARKWWHWGVTPILNFLKKPSLKSGFSAAFLGLPFINPMKTILGGVVEPITRFAGGAKEGFGRLLGRTPIYLRQAMPVMAGLPTIVKYAALQNDKQGGYQMPFDYGFRKEAGLIDILLKRKRSGVRGLLDRLRNMQIAVEGNVSPSGLLGAVVDAAQKSRGREAAGKAFLEHLTNTLTSQPGLSNLHLAIRTPQPQQSFLSNALRLLGVTATGFGLGWLLDNWRDSLPSLRANRVFKAVYEANKQRYEASQAYQQDPNIYKEAMKALIRVAPSLATNPSVVRYVLDTVATYGHLPPDMLYILARTEEKTLDRNRMGEYFRHLLIQTYPGGM